MKNSVHLRRFRWFVAVTAVTALTVGASLESSSIASPPSAGSGGAASAVHAAASTGHVGPGVQTSPHSSTEPFRPTQTQLAARAAAMAGLARHRAPAASAHTTSRDVSGSGGQETSATVQQAPGDFKVLRKSLINSTCSGCGQANINEPTVANNGKVIVETSNWNIAYSTTGATGRTPWLHEDPYAIAGAGFCCDQMVTYDPQRDISLLLQLDYVGEGNTSNGLSVSVAHGRTPTTWCTYRFAGAIGGGSTDTPDFPKIALSNNNAYLTWNDYAPNAGFARTGLARMPLDSFAACAGFNYSFLTSTADFTFALSQAPSSLDSFYWVSNWFLDGTTSGSNLRVFSWPDNSGSYSWVTRAINAYTFGTAGCGGSPDWCARLDPRWESAVITRAEYRGQANPGFAGDSILEVATTAGPSGFSNGKNYVVYNYFALKSLTYLGNDQTYSTSTNFAYPGCATNSNGYVGCAMATGTTAPGGFLLLQDGTNPTQPWGYNFAVPSISATSGWGDYVVTSPWNPQVGPFQTVLWNVNGTTVQPYYMVWGRSRDVAGFNRWRLS